MIRWLLIAACLLGVSGSPSVASPAGPAEPVRIGILAFRPKPQTQAQWEPLAELLNRAIPDRHFMVEALTFPELEAAIANQRLDFAITNPGHYVLMQHRNGLSAPLATLINSEGGQPLSAFGGVIFTRAERADINALGDLRGRAVAAVSASSLGGYQMQAYELLKAGVPMPRDRNLLATGMPQDLVVDAVLGGQTDAGFVRIGVLEGLAREGKLDLARVKVLNHNEPSGFPYQLSTRLYPEWPFAVLRHTDESLARHVAAALFLIDQNKSAARAMGIYGFTTPADYTAVEELLRELRMPPFEATPRFTTQDVWDRYRWPIVLALLTGGLILLLGARLFLANRRLSAERLVVQMKTQQLQESEARFRTVADFTFDWEYWQGPNREIFYMTPSCERVTGYSQAEFVADPALLQRIVHPEDRPAMDQHLHDIAYQEGSLIDVRIVRRDGRIRWITHHCRAVSGPNGEPMGRRVSNRDNTTRKQALLKLHEEMAFSDALMNSLPGVFFEIDSSGRLIGWNDALETLLGTDGMRAAQHSVLEVIHEDDRDMIADSIREGFDRHFTEAEAQVMSADGGIRHFYFVGKTLEIGGHTYLLGTGVDIGDRKRMETELRELATTDPLTGLANRRHFFARMAEESARAKRLDSRSAAVLMLDIDHFKRINDTYGHAAGDAALTHIAALMRDGLRNIDTLGRIGGEEFAVILPGADLSAAATSAERLRAMVAESPLAQDGLTIALTISLGVALMDPADPSTDAALVRADGALYRAKEGGRNCVMVAVWPPAAE